MKLFYRTAPYDAKVLVRDRSLFSLPVKAKVNRIEYVRDGREQVPYCDYDVLDSEWNYGFYGETFEAMFEPVTDTPFSVENPPIDQSEDGSGFRGKKREFALFPIERKALRGGKRRAAAALRMHELCMTEMLYIKINRMHASMSILLS